MRQMTLYFNDEEFKALEKLKEGRSWKALMLTLLKIKEGSKNGRRKKE